MQQAVSNSLSKIFKAAGPFKKKGLRLYKMRLLYAIVLWTVINPQAYLTPRQIFYLINAPGRFQTSIRRELRSLASFGTIEVGTVMPTKLRRGRPSKGSLKLLLDALRLDKDSRKRLIDLSRVHRRSKGYRYSIRREPAPDDLMRLADSGILMTGVLSKIQDGVKMMKSKKSVALLGWIFTELKEMFERALILTSLLFPENIPKSSIQSVMESLPKIGTYLPIPRRAVEKLNKVIQTIPYKAPPDKQLELLREGYSALSLDIGLRRDVLSCSQCYNNSKDLSHDQFNMGTELGAIFILSSPTEFDEDLYRMRVKYGFADAYITRWVKCAVKKPREPYEHEILNCLPFLKREIEICKPKMIVIVGKESYERYNTLLKSHVATIPMAFVLSNKDEGYPAGQDERFQEIKSLFEGIKRPR